MFDTPPNRPQYDVPRRLSADEQIIARLDEHLELQRERNRLLRFWVQAMTGQVVPDERPQPRRRRD